MVNDILTINFGYLFINNILDYKNVNREAPFGPIFIGLPQKLKLKSIHLVKMLNLKAMII